MNKHKGNDWQYLDSYIKIGDIDINQLKLIGYKFIPTNELPQTQLCETKATKKG